MTHDLKIQIEHADRIVTGEKTFEVRFNDRGYQKGDFIKFNVMEGDIFLPNHKLTDSVYEITHVHFGLGMKDNYVVLAIKPAQ